MADTMNHIERDVAALSNKPVDRLTTYPLAMGVCRRCVGDGKMTYREWASDPKKFASGFVAGQKAFDFDFAIGLMDLSVMAGDLGAHVRMDEQNTPFVDKTVVNNPEDYEKLRVPDIRQGRSHVLLEGTSLFVQELGSQVITAAFLEGPLLALTQSASAEKVFMDMVNNRSAVHKALQTMTDYDVEMVKAFAALKGKPAGFVWDYLWGNYSCLGDQEYEEFESQYARKLNKLVADNGMAMCIHNCADLPHLDTQITAFKPAIYSMAYYPLIPGSPSPKETIAKGYADNCLIGGQIDPQLFVRGSVEKMEATTMKLIAEVKTAMCQRGLHSKYCIASGCEVPPSVTTKLDNIKACVDTVKKYGQIQC
ncbi:MAG: Methylcobamide:CoM methyltransferase MtbA [Methanomassiliicoccales archaeon PtaU1.Bin124]|nr:MAG: Methylcobamide:CoM methyltransferase MtbA [Methanomassiliicoccales archaeon PtaU1.Bin124]